MGEPGWPIPPIKVSAIATNTADRLSRAAVVGGALTAVVTPITPLPK